MYFQDKVALITGGSSGMGRAAAIAFAKQGETVIIAARREDQSQDVSSQIHDLGWNAHFIKTDVANSDECTVKFIQLTLLLQGFLHPELCAMIVYVFLCFLAHAISIYTSQKFSW